MNFQLNQFVSKNSERIFIGAMYFFLFAGGLWHVLNIFQTLMRVLAAPMLIGLSFIIFLSVYKTLQDARQKRRLWMWAVFVIIASFTIEWIGVETSKIFGNYSYGDILKPKFFGVPIAIGFAWLCMLLTSNAVLQKIIRNFSNMHLMLKAFGISLLMVLFDLIMETAILKLNYWTWDNHSIPFQNYIGWFITSLIFSFIGGALRLFDVKYPSIAFHAYFAQLIFFGLVILK